MRHTPEEIQQLRLLLPLSELIEETLRTTPVHFGPHGHEDLVARLTLRVAVWCGKNVLPGVEQSGIGRGQPHTCGTPQCTCGTT